MKIVFSGLKNHAYDPKKGKSNEYNNFYLQLKTLGHEVHFFPFDRILAVGRRRFNQELVETIKSFKPDLFFAFIYTDEFLPEALKQIKTLTTSAAWFSDDSWRFWNHSRFWAKRFSWVVTTYSWAPELYKRFGQPNVIRSQWGVNPSFYKTRQGDFSGQRPDVSFVGGWSRPRAKIINRLQKAGIAVSVYGAGWPDSKRISDQEMINVFAASKINLALNSPPGRFNANSLGRLFFRRSLNRIVPDFHFYSNFRSWLYRGIPQIKARHFEIPACGGFTLTSPADDLENYFKIGEEMEIYNGLDDLVEKVKYYLSHDEERNRIALAGYERTIKEHTYEKRFSDIFGKLGLTAS